MLHEAGRPGLIALLGAAGVGKTTLLGALAAQLRAQRLDPQQVECGDLLTSPLPPLLLVDEADRIDDAMLAALARQDGVAVLAALPGFASRVHGLPHRLVCLGPLLEEEVPAYVAARLATLRLPADRVAATALAELAEASAGVPRRLNVLIGSSLFIADMEGSTQVRPEHVRAAAALHLLPNPQPPNPASTLTPSFTPTVAPAEPGQEPGHEPGHEPGQALMRLPAEPPPAAPAASPRRHRLGWIAAGLAGFAALSLAVLRPADPQPAPMIAEASPPPASRVAAPPMVVPANDPPTPPPDAARPDPPLPDHPAPRIVLTYQRGDAAAAARAADLAARLRLAGITAGAPFPVSAGASFPVSAGASFPVSAVASFPVSAVASFPVSAVASFPVSAVASFPGSAVASFPGSAVASFPGSAVAEADQLRYFFPQDAKTAQAAAAKVGQPGVTAQRGEVPADAPLPRPGTLEWTVSANPPAAAQQTRPAPPAAAPTVPLAAPSAHQPPDGAMVVAAAWPMPMELAWRGPEGAEAGCCFIEVFGRAPDAAWQQVFAGTADAPDRHTLPLSGPMDYAWRVLHIARDGPRYAASPWSRFTLRPPAP